MSEFFVVHTSGAYTVREYETHYSVCKGDRVLANYAYSYRGLEAACRRANYHAEQAKMPTVEPTGQYLREE